MLGGGLNSRRLSRATTVMPHRQRQNRPPTAPICAGAWIARDANLRRGCNTTTTTAARVNLSTSTFFLSQRAA